MEKFRGTSGSETTVTVTYRSRLQTTFNRRLTRDDYTDAQEAGDPIISVKIHTPHTHENLPPGKGKKN